MSAALARSASDEEAARASMDWRRAATYGVLWGIVCSVMSSLELPLGEISAADLLRFSAIEFLQWCIPGLVLAGGTMLLERRLTVMQMALALVAFALLECAAIWTIFQFLELRPWLLVTYAYVFWLALVYGGLFVAAYRLSMRSERIRRLLVRAQIARQEAESLLATAEIETLQGHVDPAFLLRVMVEVERRYAHDPSGVDRLLDPLVSFLRAAMPGVRSGASTLAAETMLAVQYARVWAELDPARATWRIESDGSIPDAPFPSLLLLPVLDQLAAFEITASRAELGVSHGAGRCTLTLARDVSHIGRWLTPELIYRLRIGLSTLFGEAWTLEVREAPAAPLLVLTFPLEQRMRNAMPERDDAHSPLRDTAQPLFP